MNAVTRHPGYLLMKCLAIRLLRGDLKFLELETDEQNKVFGAWLHSTGK